MKRNTSILRMLDMMILISFDLESVAQKFIQTSLKMTIKLQSENKDHDGKTIIWVWAPSLYGSKFPYQPILEIWRGLYRALWIVQ